MQVGRSGGINILHRRGVEANIKNKTKTFGLRMGKNRDAIQQDGDGHGAGVGPTKMPRVQSVSLNLHNNAELDTVLSLPFS